jgi:hypothetical protein
MIGGTGKREGLGLDHVGPRWTTLDQCEQQPPAETETETEMETETETGGVGEGNESN